jgi:hypothetical protein
MLEEEDEEGEEKWCFEDDIEHFESWYGSEDDVLFEEFERHNWYENEDDLFGEKEEIPALDDELMSNSSLEAYLEREGYQGVDDNPNWPEKDEQPNWEDDDGLLLDHLAIESCSPNAPPI